MQIFINGQDAVLKSGTSFEYVSENRMFSGADDYTLSISFPLRQCPQNQQIFGKINREDIKAGTVVFDSEIRAAHFSRFGALVVTEITNTDIKAQFLHGKSKDNFEETFDDVYINELDLGAPEKTSKSAIGPEQAWESGRNAVETCLPWVNNASGNLQNCAVYTPAGGGQPGGTYAWHDDTSGLSWQIYLIEATRRICAAIGYTCDLSAWAAKEEYKYLLICNAIPYSWAMPEYASALPHWSVQEFFDRVALFLAGEFEVDQKARKITFGFTRDILLNKSPITLDDVIDDHSVEVSVQDNSCDYVESKKLAYKECSHRMWKYYSCQWFVDGWGKSPSLVRYETLSDLLAEARNIKAAAGIGNGRGSKLDRVLYAADVDMYFMVRSAYRYEIGHNEETGLINWRYVYTMQPLNEFGPMAAGADDDADAEELEVVPAWIDYTNETYEFCLFLPFEGESDGAETIDMTIYEPGSAEWAQWKNSSYYKTIPQISLERGEKTKATEYYDKLYVGWWDGAGDALVRYPYPKVFSIMIAPSWESYTQQHFSLRLNDGRSTRAKKVYDVDPRMKTTFKFLAKEIPDVRSLFLIRGRRYICEKITATFSEDGMSQLLKGTFYPLKEA